MAMTIKATTSSHEPPLFPSHHMVGGRPSIFCSLVCQANYRLSHTQDRKHQYKSLLSSHRPINPIKMCHLDQPFTPLNSELSHGLDASPNSELSHGLDGSLNSELVHGLDASRLPRHVAVIMDGNSRWAQAMGHKRSEGHSIGFDTLMEIIWLSSQWGLSAFTAFIFSTENWNRSQAEVSSLMALFERGFVEHLDNFMKYNIKVKIIGDPKPLPMSLQETIFEVEKKTSQNSGLKLAIALNYGGRLDIMQAFQQVATNVQEGKIKIEHITEQVIESKLWTSWMGDVQNPDLLIRTSGEKRISNFLLWQGAYSEIMFIDTLWPAMNDMLYAQCLLSYQKRDRRFGKRKPLHDGNYK